MTVVLTNHWIWTVRVASHVVLMLTGILFTSRQARTVVYNVVKGVKYFKCKDKHGMFV